MNDTSMARWFHGLEGILVLYLLRVRVQHSPKLTPLTLAVSTQADLRDDLRTLVQANMNHNIRLLELEYQP